MRFRLILIGIALSSAFLTDSTAQRTCGTDSIHALMMGLPSAAKAHQAKVDAVNELLQSGNRDECDNPLIIPVAVHFQNTGIPLDCAIEMALSQIQTLNEDFSATNPDIDTWYDLQPSIWPTIDNKESCISFCLATLNHPSGYGLSDGDFAVTINDVDNDQNDFDGDWAGYLNFWVRPIGGGTLGYSPLGGSGNGDGVTCDPAYFGSVSCGGNSISGTYDMGRTITHEVGHYLLLEHPWGSGGCSSTDDVSDTPVTDGPQFGCPAGQTIVNCTAPILWPSYMDYCDDACLFMFSEGQVDRMETYVENSLQNLLNNAVTSCQETLCIGFDAMVSSVDESCSGQDGNITVEPLGGSGPYAITLVPGPNAINGSFNGLVEGSYTVNVVDQNGCEFTESVVIHRDAPNLSLLDVQNEYCSDGTGGVEVIANEPSTFQYSINGGATWFLEGVFNDLNSGSYTVLAQNSTGCQGQVEAVVLNESNLNISYSERSNVNCTWFDNGSIRVQANGAVEPVEFVLDGIETSNSGWFDLLSAGQHFVEVIDAVGCTAEGLFEIDFDFSTIGEDCPCDVFVPNALTPDGDLINEVLKVQASCPLYDFSIQIFDRWGHVVFQSNDPEFQWHGGYEGSDNYQGYYVENNIYTYRMTYRWGSVEANSVETQSQVGWVTVMR
ncbi:MAG: gliding motility-associated C-terminal domain-containing protein [Bacteroidetes bacterium]|nr:gliding motility-associated C-terminal domain-containing protein [Bacteroidota bacterium]